MAPSHSCRICDRPRIVTRSEQRQGIESLLSEASKSLEKYGLVPQEACHTKGSGKRRAEPQLAMDMLSAQTPIDGESTEHGDAADQADHG